MTALVGRFGRRQVDRHEPHHAPLRSGLGPGSVRRPGHHAHHAALAAREDRLCQPGHVPVRRHCHAQHPHGPAGRHRRGGHRGGQGGQRARLHHGHAEGLRHPDRRERRVPVGRPAAAPIDRARHAAQIADPAARRGDQRARRRIRSRCFATRSSISRRAARRS